LASAAPDIFLTVIVWPLIKLQISSDMRAASGLFFSD
jgi:hypothetical protein